MENLKLSEIAKQECEFDDELCFMSMPIWKYVLANILTFGVYDIVWYYKYWAKIRDNYKIKINAVLRTLFILFTCYRLFTIVNNKYLKKYGKGVSPVLLTILYIVGHFCSFSNNFLISLLSLLSIIPILVIQFKCNKINKEHFVEAENNKWTWKTTGGVVVVWILSVIAAILYFNSDQYIAKELATDDIKLLSENAKRYIRVLQYDKSIAFSNKIIKLEPNKEVGYVLKTDALLRQHKYKEVEALQKESLKKFPNSAHLNFQQGVYYSNLHKHKKAINAYTKAIAIDPNFVEAYVGRAKDCGDIENYKCSLENYEILKKMNPNNSHYYFMSSLYKANIYDLDGAMTDIDKAISMVDKPKSSFYSQKARIYLKMNDYENTMKYIQQALQIDSHDGYALSLLADIAYDNGDYKTTINITKKILKYEKYASYDAEIFYLYSKALYKTGKIKEALKQIEYAIEANPDDKTYQETKAKMIAGEEI